MFVPDVKAPVGVAARNEGVDDVPEQNRPLDFGKNPDSRERPAWALAVIAAYFFFRSLICIKESLASFPLRTGTNLRTTLPEEIEKACGA